jgi:hypothetical protein
LPFVRSLTKQSCFRALEQRREKRIPDDVEFVCVVGNGLIYGDGVVSTRSQWPEDLQGLGVPVVVLDTEHWEALRGVRTVEVIAQLVRQSQPRWSATAVAAMRQKLWR